MKKWFKEIAKNIFGLYELSEIQCQYDMRRWDIKPCERDHHIESNRCTSEWHCSKCGMVFFEKADWDKIYAKDGE